MTLNEIKKIIDESNFVITKGKLFGREFYPIYGQEEKNVAKFMIDNDIKKGIIYFFYRLDEETGEMTLLAKVDHVEEEKEKKTVKKKLDEMTEEELKKLSETVCHDFNCKCCPLAFYDEYDSRLCLSEYFNSWKKQYLETKDREIEVEVEVEE